MANNFRSCRNSTFQSSGARMKLWREGLSIPALLSYGYCKRPWYRGFGVHRNRISLHP
ncbi:protein of unknown function [Pseudomonas sp. JV551A1]|uniref:Uncharacterized protein n=1 Tax=Pseudomonas inefficax TaxID=2078786 RepID=A0AAQ1PF57_9PSED|nr:protein of unknown function [Pseudomonas sp. JV551A1]SPO64272.1 protein of unknown function [Pseudomonas inefficax]